MHPLILHGHSRPLTHVFFNTDGDLLFTAAKDYQMIVWCTETGKKIGKYNCGKGVVWAADVTLNSRKLVCGSANQKVMIFDVTTGTLLNEIEEAGPVKFVEWCRHPMKQNKFVLSHNQFGAQSSKAIKIYSLDNPEEKPECLWTQNEFESPISRVHWGPYDETIISCHENGNIMVWCALSGELLLEGDCGQTLGHKTNITGCSFTSDRILMLTACSDGSACLWDTVEWKLHKHYKTDRPLNSCDISPLYNSPTKQRAHIILGGGQRAEDVTTTSATEGKFQALLYHLIYEEEVGSVRGHFGPINTLAFMPDGGGYASGGEDGYVRVYRFDDEYYTDKFE